MSDDDVLKPFDLMGGEPGVRALVDRFYDLMDTLPEVRPLRDQHPPDLTGSRDKLFWFLCGWLGGPNHYIERFGHPRLRARHLPFAIDDAARDQWMRCMDQAMEEHIEDTFLRTELRKAVFQLASHMRNQTGQDNPPPQSGG